MSLYHEEGRATLNNSVWQYEYYLKDHLGNTRVIFADTNDDGTPEIIQEADYYPFGMRHDSSTTATNHYLYNGKELNADLGLDWYDYGFRWYDAEIGRFPSVDPMAESYTSMSPFNYVGNMPTRAIDPDGRDIYVLFYTAANHGGDAMFRNAAQTRKDNIESSYSFDPSTDKVFTIPITDISDIQSEMNKVVAQYSEKYGQTREVGIWSHGALDGPIGTEEATNNSLYKNGETFRGRERSNTSKQMSLEGWSQIDFNWIESGANCTYYGCNTGKERDTKRGPVGSFARHTSKLENFDNVQVSGQSTSSFPSYYPAIRSTNLSRSYAPGLGFSTYSTYLVSGNKGEGGKSMWFSLGDYPRANPFRSYKNGRKIGFGFQSISSANPINLRTW